MLITCFGSAKAPFTFIFQQQKKKTIARLIMYCSLLTIHDDKHKMLANIDICQQ